MPRTIPQHTALLSHTSHSADPSLVLILTDPSFILTNLSLILVLIDPPPLTHPSFEPTHTFKHRLELCHLVLVVAEARCQCQTQIGALTRFQPLLIYLSLSLNLSLFLPPPLCFIEFETLKVLF